MGLGLGLGLAVTQLSAWSALVQAKCTSRPAERTTKVCCLRPRETVAAQTAPSSGIHSDGLGLVGESSSDSPYVHSASIRKMR